MNNTIKNRGKYGRSVLTKLVTYAYTQTHMFTEFEYGEWQTDYWKIHTKIIYIKSRFSLPSLSPTFTHHSFSLPLTSHPVPLFLPSLSSFSHFYYLSFSPYPLSLSNLTPSLSLFTSLSPSLSPHVHSPSLPTFTLSLFLPMLTFLLTLPTLPRAPQSLLPHFSSISPPLSFYVLSLSLLLSPLSTPSLSRHAHPLSPLLATPSLSLQSPSRYLSLSLTHSFSPLYFPSSISSISLTLSHSHSHPLSLFTSLFFLSLILTHTSCNECADPEFFSGF